MHSGTTISELMAMVERIEVNTETTMRVREELSRMRPAVALPVYSMDQKQQIEQIQRRLALLGVA